MPDAGVVPRDGAACPPKRDTPTGLRRGSLSSTGTWLRCHCFLLGPVGPDGPQPRGLPVCTPNPCLPSVPRYGQRAHRAEHQLLSTIPSSSPSHARTQRTPGPLQPEHLHHPIRTLLPGLQRNFFVSSVIADFHMNCTMC